MHRLLVLILIAFSSLALAEITPIGDETHEEAYQRLRERVRRDIEAAERRRLEQMARELQSNPNQTFVFLRRKNDGPFTALTSKPIVGEGNGSCPMNAKTGEIDPNAQYRIVPHQDGASFDIVPTRPHRDLTSFASLSRGSRPRWTFKRRFNGSYRVCSEGDGKLLGGCGDWYIMKVQPVEGATFVKPPTDDHAIAANDIQQGFIGTCTLWAAVHSVLATKGPEEIEKLFAPDGVRFPGQKAIPVGDQFLFYWDPGNPDRKTPLGAQLADLDRNGKAESWPVLLEKAYTIWRRDLKTTDSGNQAAKVLSLVTGEKTKSYLFHRFRSRDKVYRCLRDANESGLPIVCGSNHDLDEDNPLGLSPSHAYAVDRIESQERVVLIDPHGKTVSLTFDQFYENFSGAAHTDGPKGRVQSTWEKVSRKAGDTVEALKIR